MSTKGSVEGSSLDITPTKNHHRSVVVEEVMPDVDGVEFDDLVREIGKESVENIGDGRGDTSSESVGVCGFSTTLGSGTSKQDRCGDRAAEKEGSAGDLLLERAYGFDGFEVISAVRPGDRLFWRVRLLAASAVPVLASLALHLC
jgi:hypothetical protein